MDFSNPLCRAYTLPGSGERARHGILIIHGFTGSPAHLRPLGERINSLGYTVHGILLPGHCTSLEDMATVSWQQYIDAARKGYEELMRDCDDAVVAGLSMGGLLSLLLSAEYPVRGCITLSAAIKQQNKLAPFSPVLKYILPRVISWPEDKARRGQDFQLEYDFGYSGMPVRRVADLMHLSRMAQRALPEIKCPLLVLQSDRDPTVKAVSADIIMAGAGSEDKRQVRLKQPCHVISLGPEREQIKQIVGDWLEQHLG